jgi:hypothetical protein
MLLPYILVNHEECFECSPKFICTLVLRNVHQVNCEEWSNFKVFTRACLHSSFEEWTLSVTKTMGGIQSVCATSKTGKVVVAHKNPLMLFSFFLRHPKLVVIEHDLSQTWWEQKKIISGSKGFSWWKAIVCSEEPRFPLEEAIAHQSTSW